MNSVPAGRRLMIGFDGTHVDAALTEHLQDIRPGSVILFARNIVDADQTRELIEDLRAAVDWPLVVAVDQEGGPVVRVTKGATVFPGNMALAATNRPELAYEQGLVSGSELASMGFDLNLAPVVDLQTNPENPGIGIRSFGDDLERALPFILNLVRGHAVHGIQSCLKHFPGKGACSVDAHVDLPRLEHALKDFRDPHIAIFERSLRELKNCAVMSSHIVVTGLDAERPATLSPHVIRRLLRTDLGFEGCVISDDLEMGAIEKHQGVVAASLMAARAGHDLIPICHSAAHQRAARDLLSEALSSGELDEAEHVRSLSRIESLLRASKTRCEIDLLAGRELALTIAKEAVTECNDAAMSSTFSQDEKVVFLVPSLTLTVGVEEDAQESVGTQWSTLLVEAGFKASEVIVYEPDESAEMLNKRRASLGDGPLVFGTWDLHRFTGARTFCESLDTHSCGRVVILHLRNPYDQIFVPSRVRALTAYGYRRSQLQALIERL